MRVKAAKYGYAIKLLVFLIFSVIFFVPCFTACGVHNEGASVTSLLDASDAFVQNGDTKSALAMLKKASAQAHTTYERLGVFKRYQKLGEDVSAEKVLKQSLKKIKDSQEISAVYANFLLRHDRLEDAWKISQPLKDSKYGSIYSEAFMRRALYYKVDADTLFDNGKKIKKNKKAESVDNSIFYDRRFIPIYQQAYKGSKIVKWNWNATALYMIYGNYSDAAELYPGRSASFQDSVFWGSVLYDAGKYAEALESITSYKNEDETVPVFSLMERKALEADLYYLLEEKENSNIIRQQLMALAEPYVGVFRELSLEEDDEHYPELSSLTGSVTASDEKKRSLSLDEQKVYEVLPLVYVNTALYLRDKDNKLAEYNKLAELVKLFPTYAPGLAALGEYALNSTDRPEEDRMSQEVRSAGYRTRQMIINDSIPVVEVEYVRELIEKALKVEQSSRLLVLNEQLFQESNKELESARRTARVWNLLEKNEISSSLYPDDVMNYALVLLINNDGKEEALDLFTRYESVSHGNSDEAFVVSDHLDELKLWECEVAAWFAVDENRIAEARKIYEHIIKHYGKRNNGSRRGTRSDAVVNAYINLANIYSGTGQRNMSLDCLNKASAKTQDTRLKSEILYRIGKEYYYTGDYHSAQRSLQYSVKLHPSHNKALLMLQLVQSAQND